MVLIVSIGVGIYVRFRGVLDGVTSMCECVLVRMLEVVPVQKLRGSFDGHVAVIAVPCLWVELHRLIPEGKVYGYADIEDRHPKAGILSICRIIMLSYLSFLVRGKASHKAFDIFVVTHGLQSIYGD